ncbi:hypothetical protein DKG76_10815 [Bacillus inaquosorum]|uniref:Uncharacterized protein n=1 Tax=Bacillus inaquosorum KCTC 13429 TaxID=1236548 RepID=A0A9W5PBE8_9BACI|nr:hypothetical protein [Bacillus inaquosorum]AWM17222.1 hypothetical protein DKG76_10815 [Bacillus inaquosorum]ELS59570.1 hypothetical protein BSI_39510 [Bacillus inaquosorum KCTC 13429]
MTNQKWLASNIGHAFKKYRTDMRMLWDSYTLIDFYFPHIKEKIIKNEIDLVKANPTYGQTTVRQLDRGETLGRINRLLEKENPKRILIDAVARFEFYWGEIVTMVYKAYPHKLQSNKQSSNNVTDGTKLMSYIVESISREEIINKIIEEKVRSLFYGKPTDLFTKKSFKLEFADHFETNYKKELMFFSEITARRNLFVHNNGIIDSKYIKEASNSNYNIGEKIPLTENYLRGVIALLEGLSAEATSIIIENICGERVKGGRLKFSRKSFAYSVKNNYYEKLLT